MSERNKLAEVTRTIALSGCRLTPTSLVFTEATHETFVQAGLYLQTVEACRAWWWGDFINAYCQWKITQERDKQRAKLSGDLELKEKRYIHYAGEYSEAVGVDESTIQAWRYVSAFYEAPIRMGALSWTHHREAMEATGDKESAIAWLKKAAKEEWSVTELRAAIRKESQGEAEPRVPYTYAEVVAFKRWASAANKRLSVMDTSEAKTLRADLQPAVDLAQALDARLGVGGGAGAKNVNVIDVKVVKKPKVKCVKKSRVPPKASQRR